MAEAETVQTPTPASTAESSWVDGPAGTKFYTKHWAPATSSPVVAAVLFVHGFVEHVERYNHVFPKFAEEGIAVLGFDQRGFGQTAHSIKTHGRTSWPQAMSDISFFLARLATLHPSVPLFLYGHSMGGALALAFCTEPKPRDGLESLKGVLASSPLIRQAKKVKAPSVIVKAGGLLGKLSSTLTLKATVEPSALSRDPVVNEAYAKDPYCQPIGTFKGVSDMLLGGESLLTTRYKNWPVALPLFVAHGTGDLVTDEEASRLFVDQLKTDGKPAEYRAFEGYYHEMHNEPGDLKWVEIAALTGWIKGKLATTTPAQSKL